MKFQVIPGISSKEAYIKIRIIHEPTIGNETPEAHCSYVYKHFLKYGTEGGQIDVLVRI